MAALDGRPIQEPHERAGRELLHLGRTAPPPSFNIQMLPAPEPERKAPAAPESPGLFEYWHMLVRRKWMLLGIAVGCGLVGWSIALLQPPMYEARTSLEIQGPNENFLNLKDLDPASLSGPSAAETYVETQAHILQDEGFVEKVVTQLGMDYRLNALRGPGILARFRGAIGRQQAVTRVAAHEAAVSAALKNLSVHASGTSHIVDIAFEAADPQLAAEFANALADALIDQNINARLDAARRVSDSLGRQLVDLKANYERSASELQDYARTTGMVFNPDKGSTLAEEKLRQIQEELSRTQADLAAKQSKYEQAKSASPESLPEVLDNGPLKDDQIKLTELKRQFADMGSTFTSTYFKVKPLKAQIAEIEGIIAKERGNIVDRLRNEYEAADMREKLVEQSYTRQNKIVSDEASRAVHYNVLKREVETNRAMYEAGLQKQKEAAMAAAIRASNMRDISPARRPIHPSHPRPLLNAGMGLLAGLFLGFAFVFVRENTDRSLRAPGDIAAYLNLPELGAIPSAELDAVQPMARRKDVAIDIGLKGENDSRSANKIEMASCTNETSRMAESFRSALTSLWFAGQTGKRPRVIVLTSPNAREGKTTLTSNLAIAMANTNRRVLVIDGDVRKPRLHTVFNLSNAWGFGNLLEDDCPVEDYLFEDIVMATAVPGLYVLPGGSGEVNVSSLRYHERLTDLLLRFRLEFHAVLLDTPPMLEFSDARVLGRLSDGVIMVVRAAETSRDDAAAVYRRFQEDGTQVLGSILNDWNPKKSKRGYGYRTSGTYDGK
jgi:capsular exopolysaccharide synthesis family protein